MRGLIRFLHAKDSSPENFQEEIVLDYGTYIMNKSGQVLIPEGQKKLVRKEDLCGVFF